MVRPERDKLYAAAQPILSEFQHGFVKKRSTVTNLLSYISTLNSSLEKRLQIDSIYIDFSKAFDKVPHELALKKLDRLGFPVWIVQWLRSYLSERTSFVKIGCHKSESFRTTSGVPQGSHLGPLIFIIFVNDLCTYLESCKLMYADDLKLYRIVTSVLDCVALQSDVQRLEEWCSLNGMEVNASKCKIIRFNRTRSDIVFDYKLMDKTLEKVTSIRDLGLIVDNKLRFSEHISATIAKAFVVLGFVRRNAADFEDVYTLKALYCSLVRSILEYVVQVWSPYHAIQANRIELVQKKFLRFALRRLPWNDPLRLPPYEQRCQLISLETLASRRTLSERMFVFDVLSGNLDCPELLQRINFSVPSRSLRRHSALWLPRHRTNFGENNPIDRCCRKFNEIAHLHEFGISKNVFKCCIRNVL